MKKKIIIIVIILLILLIIIGGIIFITGIISDLKQENILKAYQETHSNLNIMRARGNTNGSSGIFGYRNSWINCFKKGE